MFSQLQDCLSTNMEPHIISKPIKKPSVLLTRTTSTPKLRIVNGKDNRNLLDSQSSSSSLSITTTGNANAYQLNLNSKGNLKRGKTHDFEERSVQNPLRSIIQTKKTPRKQKRVCFSTYQKKMKQFDFDKLDKSMMGYDWIAGCLDNDSYIDDQSDQFFKDIEEFRRVNRDDCKITVTQMDSSPCQASIPVSSPELQKEKYPLCCNGKGVYMLNSRLNLIPIHGPYSECPICKTKIKGKSEQNDNYVRVSIPRSTVKSPYRLRPHRRKSYDPSDSVSLSAHCLAGWQNSKPAYAPGPTSIDLASHASKTDLTTVRALKKLQE